MNKENLCYIIFFSFLFILAVFYILFDYWKECEHLKIHAKGYEVLDNIQSTSLLGEPIYYNVIRYSDGCVKNIPLSSSEYYEKIGRCVNNE